ncbi:MAG: hypothetical protein ACRDF4_09340 [Rhabdochlamydiaceae bacterium]
MARLGYSVIAPSSGSKAIFQRFYRKYWDIEYGSSLILRVSLKSAETNPGGFLNEVERLWRP